MEEYDLLLITDATYSMDRFLASLNSSLPRIISISELTGCFSRVGLLAYRDYTDGSGLLQWSGWRLQSLDATENQPDLVAHAKSLEPMGGGDWPEAVKTALAKAYEVMRPEATTLVLLYADAPPHTDANSKANTEWRSEKRSLQMPDSYGGFGPKFVDWVSACNQLRKGEKKLQVFCIISEYNRNDPDTAGYFNFLTTMTRGACITLKSDDPLSIATVTMEILLAWMGIKKDDTRKTAKGGSLPAELSRYIDIKSIKQLAKEDDEKASDYFLTPHNNKKPEHDALKTRFTKTPLNDQSLSEYLPKKTIPVADFAQSWSTNEEYRKLVVKHLKKIIDEDVAAIGLNPIFGKLWRTICNDRTNDVRDELVNAFSKKVDSIEKKEDRDFMRKWLEESYNYESDIEAFIENVPEEARFPCVFLDPTLSFTRPTEPDHGGGDDDDDDYDDDRPITEFTRGDLLEIGRSCDPKILRRLGRVLTRLTYVETAADMPAHIATSSNKDIPKIPMALASEEHKWKFWKILLHLIVPGTLLATRPAAVLAALSLRLGIVPLTRVAEREMLGFRNKWNDTEVPENWNVSCLSLLLKADDAYRERLKSDSSGNTGDKTSKKPTSLLKEHDRQLFEHLIAYRMLELNLDSTLTARVGWSPYKSSAPLGPVVICRSCKYPRSVTIMGENGQCGICLSTEPDKLEATVNVGVSKEDSEATQATWVECCMQDCRAQYIVYVVEDLNVRAKCHYCRQRPTIIDIQRLKKPKPAPLVECSQCLNRMIWPDAYRPASFAASEFVCPPCGSGLKTIENVETTAKKLSGENSLSWLIQDTEKEEGSPFTGRSLYTTVTTIGNDRFVSQIKLFPPIEQPLTMKGKLIHNPSALISTLQDLVSKRHTDRPPCSLCFSSFHPSALRPACGRRGCAQSICDRCLSGWYGLNGPGRIINTAALACPFCRRRPSARTLAKHGMGIHAVRDLTNAVRDSGTWIYGWCGSCHSAKQHMERVCARGMPDDLVDWKCEACQEEFDSKRIAQMVRDEHIARNMQDGANISDMERRIKEALEAARLSRLKPCPGCGTMTEKISGCGHIECPCETHWCYFCGEKFSEDNIYNHMSQEHGGIYAFSDEDEDDDYQHWD